MIYADDKKSFYEHFPRKIERNMDEAWMVYDGTFKNSGEKGLRMQVFGRHVKVGGGLAGVSTGQKRGNLAPRGITTDEMKNFKHKHSPTANSLVGGSILNIDEKPIAEHLHFNDAWVCGGVHSGQEFHCASDLGAAANNVFDDEWMVTVTGRELIGLAIAGYQRVRHVHKIFGEIYRPTNRNYGLLDLVSYRDKVLSFGGKKENAKDFLLSNGMID